MRRDRRDRGQALVETALVLPIFLLVLFGLIDGARLIYTNSQLSQAAREGARLAAVETSQMGSNDATCATAAEIASTRPGGKVCPADPATLKADVVAAVNRMAVGLGSISAVYLACDSGDPGDPSSTPPIPPDLAPSGSWTEAAVTFPSCGPDGSGNRSPSGPGDLVSVRVVYTYHPITPFISSIFGSLQLSGAATMTVN